MATIDLSVDMLKKALAANGMAQYGTKEQMLTRLLGGSEKKKSGSKADGTVPKKRKATATASKSASFDQAELNFYAAERPRLVAQGITDYQDQSDELARRWALMKKASAKTSVAKTGTTSEGVLKVPAQLDDAVLDAQGLEFKGVEANSAGAIVFVYSKKAASGGAQVPTSRAKAIRVPKDTEEESDDDGESDGDDDDDMSWACQVTTDRLDKKAKKEHIAALCGDFGIPTTGSKAKLAEALAEQLHYETDSDNEE